MPKQDIEIRLFKKIKNDDLSSSIQNIKNSVKSFYESITQPMIHDFTDHSYTHSLRLLENSEKIINQLKDKLNDEELFLLLSGIYLHDIGMQCDFNKMPSIMDILERKFDITLNIAKRKSLKYYTTQEQIEIRNHHHLITGAMIDYFYNEPGKSKLGLAIKGIDAKLINDLIDICIYHSKLNIMDCQNDLKVKAGRKRLIASILRLSDELDIDNKRVSLDTVKYYHKIDTTNSIYWWLHHLTDINFKANAITILLSLKEEDIIEYGDYLKKIVIDNFYEKNKTLFEILKEYNIDLVIHHKSGIIQNEYVDKIPDEFANIILDLYKKISIKDPNDKPVILVANLNTQTVKRGNNIILKLTVNSISPVNFIEYILDSPKGNIFSGGVNVRFYKTRKNEWYYERAYKISKYTPSGEYMWTGIRVKNINEKFSSYLRPIKFYVKDI